MFKKLFDSIRNYFAPTKVLYEEVLLTEYKTILHDLKLAGSLMELLDVRKRMRAYQQLLIQNKSAQWGKPLMIELNRLWNAKYSYWKRKARGG